MIPISVVICCANVEDQLGPACESVRDWADELIVVDSGSADRTAEIARKYATKYILEPWRGYEGQKKFATDLARNDWIFFLDGDEECSPQLAAELKALTPEQADKFDLLLTPRRNYMMRLRVRAWWPDRITRIFHRKRCTWTGEALHDARQASHPSRVKKLHGWLEHKRHSSAGWGDFFSGKRADERILLVARAMYEKGKRCHWYDVVFRPGLAFFKSYVIKRGFLDGTFGWIIAQKASMSVQMKYAALWAVQNGVDAPQPNPQKGT
jgi:glycosyltransferase involved in cell wall biosynthesis